MKNKFKEIVKTYLDSKSPYALLISGKWGSGKTWYFKNSFKLEHDRKILYTSAHGINNVDEITNQIILQKYLPKRMGNPSVNAIANGLFRIMDGVGENLIKIRPGKVLKPGEILKMTTIRPNEIIVIDDIERMGHLKIEDLLAYVSRNFTEPGAGKVILITNKAKLLEKKSNQKFEEIAEKTIWQTAYFEPIMEDLIPQLAKFQINNFEEIKGLYPEIEKDIIKFCRDNKVMNIRTIQFAFFILNGILNQLREPKKHALEVLVNVVFIFSSEYKEGRLNRTEDSDAPNWIKNPRPILIFSKNKIKEEERTPLEENVFYDRYIRRRENKYFYFSSIYSFVCSGYLDNFEFKKEIEYFELNYKPNNPVADAKHLIYHYRDMEDAEFKRVEKYLFKGLKNGSYDISSVANLIVNLPYLYDLGIMTNSFNEFEEEVIRYIDKAPIFEPTNLWSLDRYKEGDYAKYNNPGLIKIKIVEKLNEKAMHFDNLKAKERIEKVLKDEPIGQNIADFIIGLEDKDKYILSDKISKLKNTQIHLIMKNLESAIKSSSHSVEEIEKLRNFIDLIDGKIIDNHIGKAILMEFKGSL